MRKLWLAGALMTTMVTISACSTSTGAPIYLGCKVSGAEASDVWGFSTLLCDQAASQMRDATGKVIQIVAPDETGGEEPWLRLEVVVKSPYAAAAKASWGGVGIAAGEGPEVEAGINDASLNEATANMLVNVLLGQTPFVARK